MAEKKDSHSKKKIQIEFEEMTMWKLGTFVFGILFIVSLLTGGFSGSSGTAAQPELPGLPPQAPQQPQGPIDIEMGDAFFKGDEDAPVTIIEFSDFECPFCARFYTDTLDQIQKNYIDTGKAKLAFKHLPLPFHPNAQKASEASECAGKIGGSDKFWAMHDKIFENQQAIGISDLKKYAKDIGVDQGKFDSCLDNGDTTDKVKAHLAEASQVGASGTPTFFVNGKIIVGAQPYNAFETAIEAELS